MSNLYDRINDDLKKAMLAKDHRRVSVLKLIKSAILYSALDSSSKENISDEQTTSILRKEVKKREEASALYAKSGDKHREEAENFEKEVINTYLPKMLEEDEVSILVDKAIKKLDASSPQMLGKVISEVKSESKGLADGSIIAKLAKERLSQ